MREYQKTAHVRKGTHKAASAQTAGLWGHICSFTHSHNAPGIVAVFHLMVMDAENNLLDYFENFRLTHQGHIICPVHLPRSVMAMVRADALIRWAEGRQA